MANLNDMMGLSPEEMDIANKRRMAEMLRGQALEPMPQGQMVSGHYVAPSPIQGLAKLLAAYKSGKIDTEANEASKAYGEQQRADFSDTAQKYFQALQGTPEKAEAYQADNPFGENLGNLQTVTPAKPGSQNDALLVALQSRSPQWQQIAMQNMTQQARQSPRDKFGAIMPADFTTESLAKFQVSGNYGDLVPVKGKANFGNVNPGQFTPESLAVYSQSGNYADLVPRFAPVTQDIGGAKVTYDPISGKELKRYEVGLKPGEMPDTIAAQERAREEAKAAVEAQTDLTKAAPANAKAVSSLDRLDSDIESVINHPGLKYAVGTYSVAPIIPGTPQADAVASIQNLADRAAVGAISEMRAASKTGGAVGAVSEKEWPKLEAQMANLNRAQSLEQFVKELRKFQSMVRESRRLINAAGQQAPAANPARARPAAPAQKPAPKQAPTKTAPAVKFLGFE